MPKYLISHVKTVATTYVIEADTEDEAEMSLHLAVRAGIEIDYPLYNSQVVEEYVQSEEPLRD